MLCYKQNMDLTYNNSSKDQLIALLYYVMDTYASMCQETWFLADNPQEVTSSLLRVERVVVLLDCIPSL